MGRRLLTILSLVGAIVSLGILGAGFQLETEFSPPALFNESYSNCSMYQSCGACRLNVDCGYCYEELGSSVANGSCLPTSADDWQRSTVGRCSTYNLNFSRTKLVWAYDFCPTQYYWLPMVGLVIYLVFFAPGMGPMPWTINAEIYPHWARGAANGASTFTNWLINLFVSISFLSLTEAIGTHGTFYMYMGFSIVGLVFLSLTLPETKGKTLEEIEGIFAKPWFGADGKFQPYSKKQSRFNYTQMREGSSTYNSVSTLKSSAEDINCRRISNRQCSTTSDSTIRQDSEESD